MLSFLAMSGIESFSESPRSDLEAETRETLNFLQNNIKLNNDPWITKQPFIENWAAVFDYKNLWYNWEIVTRKESNGNYSVRIKKRVKLTDWKIWWQTQKDGKNKMFTFSASDKNTFNHRLWEALTKIIWTNRDRLQKTGGLVYDLLNPSEKKSGNSTGNTPSKVQNTAPSKPSNISNNKETKETHRKTNLREKPIDLHYKEKNKERKLTDPGYPDKYSVEWRVTRCLRFASITDAVEDRYWIPRWLLMALMAQEWWWDPTVINLNGDWWAGLIHIQALNAAEYWMKTIQRFKWRWDENNQVDYKHWAKLKEAKGITKDNLKRLSELDDRFNPVMGIDVSARFLMGDKWWRNAKTWDDWISVANRYAWRWMADYWYSVLVFWTTINKIRWNKMPTFKDKETNKVINWKVSAYINKKWERTDLCISRTKSAFDNLNFTIDWQKVSSQEYYRYLQWQWNNYWLSDYKNYSKDHPYKK